MDISTPPDRDRDRLRALDASFATAPRRRRRNLHITCRDVSVFELLVARRVETLDALHELAFPGVSRKRALNRLGELVSSGFLDRRSAVLPGSDSLRSVYFLTPRGRAALQLRGSVGHSDWLRTRQWKLDLGEASIPHQIITNRVCDWLGAHAMPEHLLPPVRPINGRPGPRPDAIYQAREADADDRKLVWLEVDLGHYNKQRIIQKVTAGVRDEESRFLLIACPTPERKKQVLSMIIQRFDHNLWDHVAVMSFDEIRAGEAPDNNPGLLPTDEIPTMLYEL